MQDFLIQKTVLNYEQKTVKLRLHKDILYQKPIDIINSQNFFKINLDDDDTSRSRSSAREALAYLKVGENQLSQDSLASLEVTFTFDDVRYFTVEEEQKFALRYNIDGIKALPVVFYPIKNLNQDLRKHAIYSVLKVGDRIPMIIAITLKSPDYSFKNKPKRIKQVPFLSKDNSVL
ncbi:hypothetical protein [Planktothrix agardhii]|uniref:Uncharacterized protein n=1 Tax=Planktothrix agardhii (strain NIVA-CYA 126/8) TaxID=388467 RepID=A0A073CGQ8_PLAA1|nr:hypothetical protein [Planktothrix agardhii]KEI66838.1 hypothetical protein A19Y_1852 [Planktothrix agardhii NIVA-CYA 126/8]CAD5962269.1 hypothetical protein NIVACYA_03709 [Planktothrix agardhii]